MASPNDIHVGAGSTILNPDSVPIDLGLTSEGATVKYTGKLEPIITDQYLAPVGYYIPGEECTLETILSEAGATKLKYAIGYGTVSTTAAGAGQVGYDKLTFGGNTALTDYVLEYRAPRRTNSSLYIRVRLYKVNISPDLEMVFKKDGTLGFKMTAMAVCDTTKDAGNQLGYYMQETAVATDGSPATMAVSSITPVDGATDQLATVDIVVTFNRDIHPDSVDSDHFILTSAAGAIVATSVSQTDTDEVTINPTASLSAATTYLVCISGDCRALSDYTQMATSVIYDFTVAS
jgi:hypothetical protein